MGHQVYRLKDGTRVPSVTTINKHVEGDSEGLVRWAYKLGYEGLDMEEHRAKASGIGKIVHACIEADLKGETVKLDDVDPSWKEGISNALGAWRLWKETTGLGAALASEVPMVSEVHRYGGCSDWIGMMRGKVVLLDFKTGGRLYPKDLVQVAAYGNLWNEAHPDQPIEQYSLLRLGKDSAGFTWKHEHALSMDGAWRAFLLCREMYELNRALERIVK